MEEPQMLLNIAKSVAVAALAVSAAAAVHAQTVVTNITLPGLPEQVAVSPLFNRVYVAVPNFGAEPYDYLTVVDAARNTVLANVEIPPVAYAVAANDFDGLVYIGGSYVDVNGDTHNAVVAVDPRRNRVRETIAISSTAGNGILGLAVNALNGDVYVSNASDSEVDVLRGFRVVARIPLSSEPFGITVDPRINRVYVSLTDGSISVIDPRRNEITATTSNGTTGAGIVADPFTGIVFAVNSVSAPDTPTVGVFNRAGEEVTTVDVGNNPLGIDLDPVTGLVFVANSGDNTISVIDGKTDAVTSTVPVSALFLAVDPVNRRVYVSPAANNADLTVITE
jgi:YVTN family beta-propeller protein